MVTYKLEGRVKHSLVEVELNGFRFSRAKARYPDLSTLIEENKHVLEVRFENKASEVEEFIASVFEEASSVAGRLNASEPQPSVSLSVRTSPSTTPRERQKKQSREMIRTASAKFNSLQTLTMLGSNPQVVSSPPPTQGVGEQPVVPNLLSPPKKGREMSPSLQVMELVDALFDGLSCFEEFIQRSTENLVKPSRRDSVSSVNDPILEEEEKRKLEMGGDGEGEKDFPSPDCCPRSPETLDGPTKAGINPLQDWFSLSADPGKAGTDWSGFGGRHEPPSSCKKSPHRSMGNAHLLFSSPIKKPTLKRSLGGYFERLPSSPSYSDSSEGVTTAPLPVGMEECDVSALPKGPKSPFASHSSVTLPSPSVYGAINGVAFKEALGLDATSPFSSSLSFSAFSSFGSPFSMSSSVSISDYFGSLETENKSLREAASFLPEAEVSPRTVFGDSDSSISSS